MKPSVLFISPQVVIRRVDDESVTVDGAVGSFGDHVAALRAASRLPGVQRVHDRLAIRLVAEAVVNRAAVMGEPVLDEDTVSVPVFHP
jgi:hypothetical protein